jgi:hypothetical protein
MAEFIVTADASKISGADFLEMFDPGFRERNEAFRQRSIEACSRRIEAGQDCYGYGDWYVAEAQKIIAERNRSAAA